MANYRAHHEAAPSDQMRLVDRLAHAIASVVATPPVHFIALLGLCAAYIQGGLTKLLDFNAAVAEAQNFGLPFAAAVAGATIVTELAGSALILLSWAQLLKRVFEIDIQQCPHCGGSLRIIPAIVDPPVIVKMLTHFGLPARAPPRAAARAFDRFQLA